MSKTFTAILLFLLSAAAAFAQTHTLELSKQDLLVHNRGFYISQVIDARIVDNSVGVVQKSLVNNKVPAVFPKPLTEELYDFFSLHLPRQEGQLPLTLRINKLWVSEHTTSSTESGTAEVRLDFIYERDSLYYLLYSAASLNTRYGLDVTRKHEENISDALAACLQEFANHDFNSLLAKAEQLTVAQVNQKYDNLIEDAGFRKYFEGESQQSPPIYRNIIQRDLGYWWQWLSEGAIEHDPNAYLHKHNLQQNRIASGT